MAPWSILRLNVPPFDCQKREVVIDETEEHLVNTWRTAKGTCANERQGNRGFIYPWQHDFFNIRSVTHCYEKHYDRNPLDPLYLM